MADAAHTFASISLGSRGGVVSRRRGACAPARAWTLEYRCSHRPPRAWPALSCQGPAGSTAPSPASGTRGSAARSAARSGAPAARRVRHARPRAPNAAFAPAPAQDQGLLKVTKQGFAWRRAAGGKNVDVKAAGGQLAPGPAARGLPPAAACGRS
jgi:hypothetical protein